MISQVRNRGHFTDISIASYNLYLLHFHFISYDFNAFIMSEEGNTPVHLSHTTSIDTIWDFEIQGIDNQGPLPLTEEQSEND